VKNHERIYIGGEWVAATGEGSFEVTNASTEEIMGRVPAGSAADVDRAVKAARGAFDAWSSRAPSERADFLRKIQAGIAGRMQEIGQIIAGEVGMPVGLSSKIQAGLPALTFGSAADLATSYVFEERVGNSLVVKEPVGVVGCITPWNYPLHQIAAKVAPALAAGCTVVLKPSEVAPLSAFVLAEIVHEIGLPPGVFNLVSGDGATVGEAIAGHPEIDMVSFTGSTRAGKRVTELAAKTVKRVALELGGKSANVILDDADLATAVKAGVQNCYLNSGQTCSAWTRMLVPRSKHDEAVRIAKETAESMTPGSAFEPTTRLGPLVSKTQQERVRGYIRKGMEEGATLVTGGPEQPEGLPKGYFVKPTVFAGVDNAMTIAQEEIFGPVLAILPYDTEEDAIRIANDTVYGLAGAVWSSDPERAKRVARRLRTGQVDINGGKFNPFAPFGGYKQSGRGREYGKWGFEEFLEVKSIQVLGGVTRPPPRVLIRCRDEAPGDGGVGFCGARGGDARRRDRDRAERIGGAGRFVERGGAALLALPAARRADRFQGGCVRDAERVLAPVRVPGAVPPARGGLEPGGRLVQRRSERECAAHAGRAHRQPR
jgi:acyl-CoA reductase-like NAD-dependent aldehyde dehydrogenase